VSKAKRIAIIGGGFGGLSAAISLRSRGFEVDLYEMTATLGGKAGTRNLGNYRFDTGPSLLTLPQVFDRLFSKAGKRREDYVEFMPLDPITNYWFSDGSRLAGRPLPFLIDELEKSLGVPRQESERFFSYAEDIHTLTTPVFLERSLHEFSTWVSKPAFKAYSQIHKVDIFRTMYSSLSSFFSSTKAIQLFSRFATYNGSDPYQAPATLNTIAYVEYGLGGFGVKGGIFALTKALEKLCTDIGVIIRRNTKVESIELDKSDRIQGVLIRPLGQDTSSIPYDAVVSDLDILTLYEHILKKPKDSAPIRFKKLPPSTSGLVFYWGMNKSYPDLGVNNIFFSQDYQKEFFQIHHEQRLPDDPTVYVNITSKISPEDAPPGGENWFVLVNAPPDGGQNWQEIAKYYRKKVIKILEASLGVDVEKAIEVEEILDPKSIMENTGSWRGSLYGISSNTKAAAFLRPSNRVKKYPGLYTVGGSVHPGGGMPLVTLSGMIAAELLEKYEGSVE